MKNALQEWGTEFGNTDCLRAGFEFPLDRGQRVTVEKGFRANRYLKRGLVLTYQGLGAYLVLFTTSDGKWVQVHGTQLGNLKAEVAK